MGHQEGVTNAFDTVVIVFEGCCVKASGAKEITQVKLTLEGAAGPAPGATDTCSAV